MKYLFLLLFLFTLINSAYSAEINANKVNIRSGPSLKSKLLGLQLSKGDKVSIGEISFLKIDKIGSFGKFPWFPITYKEKYGFVFGAFISFTITKDCKMYKSPERKSQHIKVLKKNSKVRILKFTEPIDDTAIPYYCLVLDQSGKKGWIGIDDIKFEN